MKNTIVILSLILIACFYHPFYRLLSGRTNEIEYWNSVWADKWFYLMGILSLSLTYRLKQKYHWSICVLVAYLLLSALWAFGYSGSYYFALRERLDDIKANSSYAFIAIALTVAFVSELKIKDLKVAEGVIGIIGFLNSAMIIAQRGFYYDKGLRGGFLGNPSMSGCFIAFALPFMRNRLQVVFGIIAILLTGTSQPVGVLAVVGAASLMWFPKRKRLMVNGIGLVIRPSYFKIISQVSFVLATACVFVYLTIPKITSKHGRSPFDDSGRFEMWKIAITPLFENGHYIVGQGTGSTAALVPRLHLIHESKRHGVGEHFKIDEWKWLHSDFIQLLFENGLVGLCLGILASVFALYFSYLKSQRLFAATSGLIATAIFNFPAHFPIHAFSGALILAMCFRLRNEYDDSFV